MRRWPLRISVPLILLPVCLLGLLVVLLNQHHLAAESARSLQSLHAGWEAAGQGGNGSDLVTFDRLVRSTGMPSRAGVSNARLSLLLTVVSIGLFFWLLREVLLRLKRKALSTHGRARREQAAILQLLDEMAPLARGDLRVRASVTEAMTGALADAFNHAVSELRWLVGTVTRSAEEVSQSVGMSRERAETLSHACNVQAREIHRASNYLTAMSNAMMQVSAAAGNAAHLATTTAADARTGAVAVDTTVVRLTAIRDEAELTTRLMHRLVENARAIDARVAAVSDVARRTEVLALNATIRASVVNSQPTDAARLSDEVSRLSKLLGHASRDIVSLTRTIVDDAADTARAMEETTAALVDSLSQTEQTSSALSAIDASAEALQQLIADIAERSVRQSGVVRQLSANMSVVNRITRDNADGVQTTAASLDQLQSLATDLRQGVEDFRLPAGSDRRQTTDSPARITRRPPDWVTQDHSSKPDARLSTDARSTLIQSEPVQARPHTAEAGRVLDHG